MKASLSKGKIKTVWYENKATVNEYLDNACSRRAHHHKKDLQVEKFSWLEVIKRTLPVKYRSLHPRFKPQTHQLKAEIFDK
jgi:hypothetical protein